MTKNQSLAKLSTSPLLTGDLVVVQEMLTANRDTAHLLTPFCRTQLAEIPPGYKVSIRSRMISPAKEAGETYKVPKSSKLALTKQGIMNLSLLAGVEWEDDVMHSTGETNDPNLVSYSAKAWVIEIDGQRRPFGDGYTLDLRDGSGMAVSYASAAELAQQRRNIHQMCRTKAKLRVLRVLLGIQDGYEPDEFRKPFIVLKMVPDVESITHPLLQLAHMIKVHNIGKEVFGFMNAQFQEGQLAQLSESASTMVQALNCAVQQPEQHPAPGRAARALNCAAQPPVEPKANLQLPPRPESSPTSRTEEDPLTPEEVAAMKAREDREALIMNVERLYVRKKGATRAEASPKRPPLTQLTNEELKSIEAHLAALVDVRDMI